MTALSIRALSPSIAKKHFCRIICVEWIRVGYEAWARELTYIASISIVTLTCTVYKTHTIAITWLAVDRSFALDTANAAAPANIISVGIPAVARPIIQTAPIATARVFGVGLTFCFAIIASPACRTNARTIKHATGVDELNFASRAVSSPETLLHFALEQITDCTGLTKN